MANHNFLSPNFLSNCRWWCETTFWFNFGIWKDTYWCQKETSCCLKGEFISPGRRPAHVLQVSLKAGEIGADFVSKHVRQMPEEIHHLGTEIRWIDRNTRSEANTDKLATSVSYCVTGLQTKFPQTRGQLSPLSDRFFAASAFSANESFTAISNCSLSLSYRLGASYDANRGRGSSSHNAQDAGWCREGTLCNWKFGNKVKIDRAI